MSCRAPVHGALRNDGIKAHSNLFSFLCLIKLLASNARPKRRRCDGAGQLSKCWRHGTSLLASYPRYSFEESTRGITTEPRRLMRSHRHSDLSISSKSNIKYCICCHRHVSRHSAVHRQSYNRNKTRRFLASFCFSTIVPASLTCAWASRRLPTNRFVTCGGLYRAAGFRRTEDGFRQPDLAKAADDVVICRLRANITRARLVGETPINLVGFGIGITRARAGARPINRLGAGGKPDPRTTKSANGFFVKMRRMFCDVPTR